MFVIAIAALIGLWLFKKQKEDNTSHLRVPLSLQFALIGVNAAVVGILVAAFYHPVWTSSILTPTDFALAAVLFAMLVFWKLPPWVVVLAGAFGGTIIALT